MVGPHGVHRVLPLDQALQPVGFRVDRSYFPVERADAVGAIGGLDGGCGGGGGGGGEGGWLRSGIDAWRWSVVIVVGVGERGGSRVGEGT